jgi:hypothetical protein
MLWAHLSERPVLAEFGNHEYQLPTCSHDNEFLVRFLIAIIIIAIGLSVCFEAFSPTGRYWPNSA